jgi:outer membrane receptor protein involved in Fe transport
MACVSTRYYRKLDETIFGIFQISSVQPPQNAPKAAITSKKKIAGYAFIAAPIFAGILIGSTSEFGTAQAQQASTGGTEALPQIDVIATNPGPVSAFQTEIEDFNKARDNTLMPKIGATSYTIDSAALNALPQGTNTPIDKVVLQAPGVSYDSAVSNPDFHVRNEFANVQYRIDGIMLPEGVSGLGPVLETSFVGNLNLLTGVLPAQYGLRTAGVIDITTPSQFTPGGSVTMTGGSFGTISPSFEYGGSVDDTQYFVTGRYTQNNEGLENATANVDPIHDHTTQGKFFGYASTILNDSNRLTFISGESISRFQIPNVQGQTPLGDFGGTDVNSADLNENEYDSFIFNILALQSKGANFDTQLAVFSRYTEIHFVPDIFGDLAFNDVASDVTRQSLLNGAQFDGAYQVNAAHTLRGGFDLSAEQTNVDNTSTVLPLDANGNPLPTPFAITDADSKLGWNIGGYIQDEWKLTPTLTLNAGLRFDQLYQFVSANQLSPRLSFVYNPFENTSIHIGYARYFTPPAQAQAVSSNVALFVNTTQQPVVAGNDPVRPERSNYFDAGIDQKVFPGLTAGVDAYYKIATDLLDDGQFGQAVVLTQFNYAQGYSEGVELKAKYQNGGFTAYANFAAGETKAKDVVSNQYLFDDPVEFAFIANNYHFTDDTQLFTASAGASYLWNKTLISIDGIFGSGLRTGFANMDSQQPYTTFNLGISHDFDSIEKDKPLTVRFSIANLLDTIYVLRDGTGIGEFAPQYGARRGFFLSLSQKL